MLDVSGLYDLMGGKPPDEDIVGRLRGDDALEVPIELTDLDLWANYVNDDLYAMDVKVRQYLKATSSRRERKGGMRTTASAVFAWIYGRKPGPSDSAACRLINELMRYYCTEYTGVTTYKGRKVPRVYIFSRYAATNRRPYSLRLRLEESDGGKATWRKSPVDDASKRRHGRREHSEDGS